MSTKQKTRPNLPLEIADAPPSTDSPLTDYLNSELARPVSAKGIYNSQGKALTLGKKIGVGGEGSVYEIAGQPDLVAKLYHELPELEKAAKLEAMAKLGSEQLFRIAAWPVEVLRDRPGGNVIGFVMNKIGHAEEVHTLHSPKSRLKKFPDASWSFLVHVAANIARAIAAMHEMGFVIGDVNPKNILVTRKATVYLLDCDSFQFTADGNTYRCEGGFPEYTAPELQGQSFSQVERHQEHDSFGLAVVIFQLLFLGRHPYSGRFLGAGEMPLEQAMREWRFAYGADAGQRNMQPPPGTLSLDAIPTEVTALLRRAFLTTDRPNPQDWIEPLGRLAAELKSCAIHSGHYFYQELTACPWCDIEARARLRLFNFQVAGGRSNKNHFKLNEIWDEVESLQLTAMSGQKVNPPPKISPEAERYARNRRNRFGLAMAFAALAGFLTGMIFNMPLMGFAVWMAILAGRKIADAEARGIGTPLTIFGAQPNKSDDPFALRLNEIMNNARQRIYELERELNDKKNGAPAFAQKVADLHAKLYDYETHTKQSQNKLKRLAKDYGSFDSEQAKEAKAKIIEEADRERARLEHEITSTAYYLRHLKKQLDAKHAQLLPELARLKQQLAQAEKDLEVVGWKNPLMPIILLVIATSFVGSTVSPSWFPEGIVNEIIKRSIERSYRDKSDTQFNTHFNQGLLWIQEAEYTKAKEALLAAAPYIKTFDWNDRYASYYHNLCFVRVALKEESQVIENLKKELDRNPEYDENSVQLIILYTMKKQTADAVNEFQILKMRSPQIAASLRAEMKTHGIELEFLENFQSGTTKEIPGAFETFSNYYSLGKDALKVGNYNAAKNYFLNAVPFVSETGWRQESAALYYDLCLTRMMLGEDKANISSLENRMKSDPGNDMVRLQLIIFYSMNHKDALAAEHYRILSDAYPFMAKTLKQVLQEHGVKIE